MVAASGTGLAKQFAIVTDTANSTANLTSAGLVKIFNAQTRSWPDGKKDLRVVKIDSKLPVEQGYLLRGN